MLKFTAQKHQLTYTLAPAWRRADLLGHVATSIKDESYRCSSPPQASLFVLVTAPSIPFYSSMFPWPSQHLSSLITRAYVCAIRARTTLDCFCSFCRVYHGGWDIESALYIRPTRERELLLCEALYMYYLTT